MFADFTGAEVAVGGGGGHSCVGSFEGCGSRGVVGKGSHEVVKHAGGSTCDGHSEMWAVCGNAADAQAKLPRAARRGVAVAAVATAAATAAWDVGMAGVVAGAVGALAAARALLWRSRLEFAGIFALGRPRASDGRGGKRRASGS